MESELSSCKLHLGLAERAAKSAVDSAARTNQVLESLAGERRNVRANAERMCIYIYVGGVNQ